MKTTHWSQPKTNLFAGILDLRQALASGYKAKLIRARNEDCSHPIRVKHPDKDFRQYKHSIGYASSVNQIKNNGNLNEFEKYLSLNYVSVFGSKKAADRYYETGICDKDNFNNTGFNHLVKVDDYIKFLEDQGEHQRADIYKKQYRAPEHVDDVQHFFDFFRYVNGCPYSIKKFKHKLWVVQLLDDKDNNDVKVKIPTIVKVLNFLMFPLKYIPRKSVLRMPEYKCVTFRIGGVTNGFAVEFQIPKKFKFK